MKDQIEPEPGQQDEGDGYIPNADAGRMGKAVEYLVAAGCILTTRGRLNVSTSLVDDEGVDLVFFARGSTATLAVQVKARMSDSKTVRTKERFVTSVREATFSARRDLDMLFVLADVTEGRYTKAWLVPSAIFASRTKVRANQTRRFSASVKATTKDQWSEFRLEPSELPTAILDRLAGLVSV
jgi:hypothetical protein